MTTQLNTARAPDLEKQMRREIYAINALLKAHKINAGTKPAWTLVAGSAFIAYGIRLGPGETIAKIAARLPELEERISAIRGTRSPVRLRRTPLALETPHPHPQALLWESGTLRMGDHCALVGRRYDYTGASDIILDFANVPHALVAGITGAGKSVLVSVLLSTLLLNTSPADLRVYLVDLKNEDLVPFSKLPHVEAFAGMTDDATQVIDHVHDIKDQRVKAGRANHTPRVLLVIDELAELASIPGALDTLGRIAAIGRSKAINVVAATQKPTTDVVGKMSKANFTLRLVGQVGDPNEAVTATGRKQTGAELLPGRGAFLRIQGPDVERIQSYFIAPDDVDRLCRMIANRHKSAPLAHESVSTRLEPAFEPVRTGSRTTFEPGVEPPTASVEPPVEPPVEPAALPVFPLADKRELEPHEAAHVRKLYTQGMSKNALIFHVYDAKSGRYMDWINDALMGGDDDDTDAATSDDDKVIRLRRGA